MFRTGVDLVPVLAGMPLLLLLWTVTWVDFARLLNTLTLGVQRRRHHHFARHLLVMLAILRGGHHRSPSCSTAGSTAASLATPASTGACRIRSCKGATYAGYILAAVFALTAAGLDFSNLALIAGALGVGIGLGLQSIVNNFVSGLILLAERPIRVGDWVSLPAGEGIVRRINVRSTEIETFDSCSIIVPNSAARHGAGAELDAQRQHGPVHRGGDGRLRQRSPSWCASS